MSGHYRQALDKIQASEEFKQTTLLRLKMEEKKGGMIMKINKKWVAGLAVCAVMMFGFFGIQGGASMDAPGQVAIDLTDRIEVDNSGIAACAAVNIEGVIEEVSEDGLSIKLENGPWVHVVDETEIGISGPNAADKDEQFFEPTFRVGNSIAGFTENENDNEVVAYAIYTNWNWEDPIR